MTDNYNISKLLCHGSNAQKMSQRSALHYWIRTRLILFLNALTSVSQSTFNLSTKQTIYSTPWLITRNSILNGYYLVQCLKEVSAMIVTVCKEDAHRHQLLLRCTMRYQTVNSVVNKMSSQTILTKWIWWQWYTDPKRGKWFFVPHQLMQLLIVTKVDWV